MRASKNERTETLSVVRCAIYTRKSTEEGLEQEFNTLDAQRESAEAYISSQQHEGWNCIPDRYDDGGFTGGNMERPALQRLMRDIEAGRVDCVIVYKVDRLSRSLMDFARIIAVFDEKKVSFVSVTQAFNTANSMGRLVLNVLLSFAQFEREIISERTRDKMAAMRRKGKWAGGTPPLGYDIDPDSSRLILNPDEAVRVRAIFQMYLEHEALLPVVRELAERGWTNKRYETKGGNIRGGKYFTKTHLHRMLTHVLYIGKIDYHDEIYAGEHPAIVDPTVFQKVQAQLQKNARTVGAGIRNKHGSFLKSILRCSACNASMTPAHTTKEGRLTYRYYVCCSAQKRGWDSCPTKSIPASQIEEFVVERIRCIGKDPELIRETVAQARQYDQTLLDQLDVERRNLERDLGQRHAEVRKLSTQLGGNEDSGPAITRLAEVQERIRQTEIRHEKVREQIHAIRQRMIEEPEVALVLSQFGSLWKSLTPKDQARLIHLLIERVEYDGGKGSMSITFHPLGIQKLADQLTEAQQHKEKIA